MRVCVCVHVCVCVCVRVCLRMCVRARVCLEEEVEEERQRIKTESSFFGWVQVGTWPQEPFSLRSILYTTDRPLINIKEQQRFQ